jgi:hypothetical protein
VTIQVIKGLFRLYDNGKEGIVCFILDDVETTFALFDGSMKASPKDFSLLNAKTKGFKPSPVMIILA